MKLRKSLVNPVTRQNISSCSILSPEIVMHDAFSVILWTSADICLVHDDLGWKNQTTHHNCRFSATGIRACNLFITSPAPYRYATKPHSHPFKIHKYRLREKKTETSSTVKCSRTSTCRFEISSSSWRHSPISATLADGRRACSIGSRWLGVHGWLDDRDVGVDDARLDVASLLASALSLSSSSWTGSRSPASKDPSTGRSGYCCDSELLQWHNHRRCWSYDRMAIQKVHDYFYY